jgi:nitrogen fixation protein
MQGAGEIILISGNVRYMTKHDADEAVSVVSLTSSSGGYINGRNSANLELLIDKTSSIYP